MGEGSYKLDDRHGYVVQERITAMGWDVVAFVSMGIVQVEMLVTDWGSQSSALGCSYSTSRSLAMRLWSSIGLTLRTALCRTSLQTHVEFSLIPPKLIHPSSIL